MFCLLKCIIFECVVIELIIIRIIHYKPIVIVFLFNLLYIVAFFNFNSHIYLQVLS